MKLKKMHYSQVLIGMLCMTSAVAMLKQDILTIHNKLRLQHSAPKLVWDDALANYAEKHASQCKFQHSGSPYGENLAAGYPTVFAAVQGWYNEGARYSYANPGFSTSTGHFTQVVWRSSKKIGCGYVTCNGENGTPGKYLVCEYSPAGNVTNSGYFAANVLPLQ